MLGSKEQRTEGMRRQAQELIDQAYERGFKAGREDAVGAGEMAYKRGLDDAWETARKICVPTYHGGLSSDAVKSIFGETRWSFDTISHNYTASEAIEKIRKYEEQKKSESEEIKVGDEVISGNRCYVVVRILSNGTFEGIGACGTDEGLDLSVFCKTGRHFPQIAYILKQLREANDADRN